MKLSVVVPYYNVERYLHDCLASLAGQTLRDLEVLLVDDGSLDGSRAIAEEFVARDPRFRLITQANQGLGPARNTGMRQARGTYLTFVDSDDLVPRDAYRLMTATLDRTGSDFAAGDARRYNIHGVRESWVHRDPFVADRRRTTVREFPPLAQDRMVWNKVYRRSFWERHGYEFPAMLYEDYPVTLRAYLEASSVDVISQPVYIWRERDDGELSITQRAYELPNVADRVASDLMVLEQVAPGTGVPAAIRGTVHDLLLVSDVSAVSSAVALSIGRPDHAAILDQAQRLARELDPDAVARRGRLDRLRIAMILAGRPDVLRTLIDVGDGLAPPLTHERRGRRRLIDFGPGTPPVPDELRELEEGDLKLVAQIQRATWREDVLRLDVRAWIRFSRPAAAPLLRAWLVERSSGRRLDLGVEDARLEDDGAEVHATVTVPGRELCDLTGDRTSAWELVVDLDAGSVHRSGPATHIAQGSATIAEAWSADDSRWVAAGRDAGNYIVRVLHPAAWITSAESGYRGEIALSGRTRSPLPLTGAELEIGEEPRVLLVPVSVDPFDRTRWDAHVQLGAIADPRHHDDFVPVQTELGVHLVTPRDRWPVQVRPGLSFRRFEHRGREIQFLAARFLGARIDEMDPQFMVEEARVDGTVLELSGRWLGEPSDTENALLSWFHGEETDEVLIPLHLEGESFTFSVDVADLTARMEPSARPRQEEWLLSFVHAGAPMTAHVSKALVRRLPEPVRTPHGTVELSTHRVFAARLVARLDAR